VVDHEQLVGMARRDDLMRGLTWHAADRRPLTSQPGRDLIFYLPGLRLEHRPLNEDSALGTAPGVSHGECRMARR
jgi:hypothetical protein